MLRVLQKFSFSNRKSRKALTTFVEELLLREVSDSIDFSGGWFIMCKEDKIACEIQNIISTISSFIVTVSFQVFTKYIPFNSNPFVIRKINHKVKKMFQYKNVLFLSVLVLVVKHSSQSPLGSVDQDANQDKELNVDFKCITNPSCIKSVSNKLVKGLNQKQVMDFGAFVVEPVENPKNEGRSVSKFSDILSNNALRIPFGGYSISLQKSEDYDNYLEVSISNAVEGKTIFLASLLQ